MKREHHRKNGEAVRPYRRGRPASRPRSTDFIDVAVDVRDDCAKLPERFLSALEDRVLAAEDHLADERRQLLILGCDGIQVFRQVFEVAQCVMRRAGVSYGVVVRYDSHSLLLRAAPSLERLDTIDDPGAYTRPWTMSWNLTWNPSGELAEYICQENNRYLWNLTGDLGQPMFGSRR